MFCTQNNVSVVDEESRGGEEELSLSACPGVENRPPSEKKIANPWGYARGGMVTGRIEPCIIINKGSHNFPTVDSYKSNAIQTLKLHILFIINAMIGYF